MRKSGSEQVPSNGKIVCFDGAIKRCTIIANEQDVVENVDAYEQKRTEIESRKTNEIIDKIISDGVKVIITSGVVDEFCTTAFQQAECTIVERVERADLRRLNEIINATVTMPNALEKYTSKNMGRHDCCAFADEQFGQINYMCIKSQKTM